MSHDQASSRNARIEAYLDGRLTGPDRASFEQEIAADSELREALGLQQSIDSALVDLFPVPSPARLAAAAERLAPAVTTPTAARAPGRRRWLRPLAAAAILALTFVGGYALLWESPPPEHIPPSVFRTLATVYRDEARGEFKPQRVCLNDEQFAGFVQYRFGAPLLAHERPPGVEILGWSYANSVSPKSVYMLCRVDKHEVLVFLDLLQADDPRAGCAAPGTFQFRREVGPFVLYEVTPLDKPRLLDLFYLPESK